MTGQLLRLALVTVAVIWSCSFLRVLQANPLPTSGQQQAMSAEIDNNSLAENETSIVEEVARNEHQAELMFVIDKTPMVPNSLPTYKLESIDVRLEPNVQADTAPLTPTDTATAHDASEHHENTNMAGSLSPAAISNQALASFTTSPTTERSNDVDASTSIDNPTTNTKAATTTSNTVLASTTQSVAASSSTFGASTSVNSLEEVQTLTDNTISKITTKVQEHDVNEIADDSKNDQSYQETNQIETQFDAKSVSAASDSQQEFVDVANTINAMTSMQTGSDVNALLDANDRELSPASVGEQQLSNLTPTDQVELDSSDSTVLNSNVQNQPLWTSSSSGDQPRPGIELEPIPTIFDENTMVESNVIDISQVSTASTEPFENELEDRDDETFSTTVEHNAVQPLPASDLTLSNPSETDEPPGTPVLEAETLTEVGRALLRADSALSAKTSRTISNSTTTPRPLVYNSNLVLNTTKNAANVVLTKSSTTTTTTTTTSAPLLDGIDGDSTTTPHATTTAATTTTTTAGTPTLSSLDERQMRDEEEMEHQVEALNPLLARFQVPEPQLDADYLSSSGDGPPSQDVADAIAVEHFFPVVDEKAATLHHHHHNDDDGAEGAALVANLDTKPAPILKPERPKMCLLNRRDLSAAQVKQIRIEIAEMMRMVKFYVERLMHLCVKNSEYNTIYFRCSVWMDRKTMYYTNYMRLKYCNPVGWPVFL